MNRRPGLRRGRGPGAIDNHPQHLLSAFALQFDIENVEPVRSRHSRGQFPNPL